METYNTIGSVELMNIKEVMQVFGITRMTVQNWKKKGKLPFIKIGGKVYFYRSEIMESLMISNKFSMDKEAKRINEYITGLFKKRNVYTLYQVRLLIGTLLEMTETYITTIEEETECFKTLDSINGVLKDGR